MSLLHLHRLLFSSPDAEALKYLWNIKAESFVHVSQYVYIVKILDTQSMHALQSVILGFLHNLSEQYMTNQSPFPQASYKTRQNLSMSGRSYKNKTPNPQMRLEFPKWELGQLATKAPVRWG